MTDLKFKPGSTFKPVITYWQDAAKTMPHDLTGFTANFLVKDDKSDADADAVHDLASDGGGLILRPLTAVIEPTLTDEQTLLMDKSIYYWQQKIESPGGEVTIIAEGRLVKS